jgi:membrane-associated phospholipid phosphatase
MRRRLLFAAVLCAAAAAAVWAAAFHVSAVRSVDLRVLERLVWLGGPRGARLATDVTGFFDPVPGFLLAAALVGGAALAGRRRQAVVAAVTIAGAELTAQAIKSGLAAQRAFPADHYMPAASWPSGHTTGAVSLAIALVIVSPPALRRVAALAGALVAGATMISLIVLASHYPSDVAGGVLVAAGWACLALAALPSAVTARLPQRLGPATGEVDSA